MPRLDIHLLGPPRIERDGVPVQADTRKATALLAYLAVTGESHSREALAALFWPDYDESHARAALRRTLSALNKALGGAWLDVEREAVGLNRGPDLYLDVEHFHRLLAECLTHGHPTTEACSNCLSPLDQAAALYRGDFLAGFSLRDSANFDDWQFFQAEGLRRELAGALERLTQARSRNGQIDQAIASARRWLALDPLHEPAHRRLMQLYASSGQRAAALRQYRECVRVLEAELGVAPLEETTRLYEAIKEGSSGAGTQWGRGDISPALPRSRSPAYPLVGRATEWAALLKAYASVGANGHVLALQGEAGIGKTRLAEDLLDYARAAGAATIAAHCYEGESNLAYAPFVEALRAVLGHPDRDRWLNAIHPHVLSEAARLAPELASQSPGLPPAPPLDSPGAQARFFDAIVQMLLASCQPPPSIHRRLGPASLIFFDDAHWADEASLDLLAYIARRLTGRRLCLLLAWRSEQIPVGHRLRHLLADAARAGAGMIVSLSRLSQSAVTEWVQSAIRSTPAPASIVNSPSPERLAETLYRETEGLPFFLVEYLTVIGRGGREPVGDDWSLLGGVRDLLHSRLAPVGEAGRQLLSAASVVGRSFDFETLKQASGRSDEETVTALEALIAHGLVGEMSGDGGDGPAYDFSHDKLRALIYEETSLARRRLLHRRVAEALVGRARRRGGSPARPDARSSSAAQIAHHYRLAGQEEAAAEYFKLAGDHARTLYANADALAHFRLALALGHPEPAALHEAIGDLQTLSGEYGGALAAYETAAALCDRGGLARVERKLGSVYHRRGEWESAETHFQAALAALGEVDSRGEGARLHAEWSLTAHRRGQTDRAQELARRALELAEAAGEARALAQAHNLLGILATSQNDLDSARDHLEHSLALAETLADAGARVAALNNLALAHRASGDIERALELTETALAVCASQGDRHRQAALHNNLADLLHAAGRSAAAMSHLKQAVAIFAEIGVEAGNMQPEIWKLTAW